MSRDTTLLNLELRLLIVRHGKAQVSEALTAIDEVDLNAIDSRIRVYEENTSKNKPQRRPRKSIEEMIRDVKPDSLDAERLIKKLAHAYENKEFLPEFRDVKRFLQSRRIPIAKFRSRVAALPVVLSVLAQCHTDDLKTLDAKRLVGGSDLGIITDQILGRASDSGTSASRAGPGCAPLPALSALQGLEVPEATH